MFPKKEDPKVNAILDTVINHDNPILTAPHKQKESNMIIESILALTCADANIDLEGYEKEQLKGTLKERRAFNNVGTIKNNRGISVENIRGYVADSRYDVEMKLHV